MPVCVISRDSASKLEQDEQFRIILNFIEQEDFEILIELVKLVAYRFVDRIDIEADGEIKTSKLGAFPYSAITIRDGSIFPEQFVEVWIRRKVSKLQFEKFRRRLAVDEGF